MACEALLSSGWKRLGILLGADKLVTSFLKGESLPQEPDLGSTFPQKPMQDTKLVLVSDHFSKEWENLALVVR